MQVGVGMCMEGIEQNPVVYELMSEMAFRDDKVQVPVKQFVRYLLVVQALKFVSVEEYRGRGIFSLSLKILRAYNLYRKMIDLICWNSLRETFSAS